MCSTKDSGRLEREAEAVVGCSDRCSRNFAGEWVDDEYRPLETGNEKYFVDGGLRFDHIVMA